jgi:ABC-type transport system substrate-binding protein
MKKLALALTALAALTGQAVAADMAVKAPPPVVPIMTWTGFYVGANAGYNWGYYSNPQLDKLLDSASAEPDEKKRFALYAQAQKLLVEESPALFVYEKNYRLPMNGKLQGFVFNGVYIETLDFYALHKE